MESRGELPHPISSEEERQTILVPEAVEKPLHAESSQASNSEISENSSTKEPWDMTFEEFSEEYNRIMHLVAEKEKKGGLDPNFLLNYRVISPKEQVLLENDWKEFSRQRGFTEEDIAEYERWLTLSGQRANLPGAINDPWRRNRPNWEQYLYNNHLQYAQKAGYKNVPKDNSRSEIAPTVEPTTIPIPSGPPANEQYDDVW